eukprot:10485221-Ditylum_brightwellii.AAC.2
MPACPPSGEYLGFDVKGDCDRERSNYTKHNNGLEEVGKFRADNDEGLNTVSGVTEIFECASEVLTTALLSHEINA